MPQLIMMREIQTEGEVTLSMKVHTGSLAVERGGRVSSWLVVNKKGGRTKTKTHTAM